MRTHFAREHHTFAPLQSQQEPSAFVLFYSTPIRDTPGRRRPSVPDLLSTALGPGILILSPHFLTSNRHHSQSHTHHSHSHSLSISSLLFLTRHPIRPALCLKLPLPLDNNLADTSSTLDLTQWCSVAPGQGDAREGGREGECPVGLWWRGAGYVRLEDASRD